jgi:6-phosphogluconate dehydrogenase
MSDQAAIGLIGLGTMGANLALNIAEAGHRIAVHNRSPEKTRAFHEQAGALRDRIVPTETLEDLVDALASPRTILMMVPAGAPVADQIDALVPLLAEGDILIDGGNSDWTDSRDRATALGDSGLRFLGLGVSGGAEGARHGPSLMAGGHEAAWAAAETVLTSIAARFGDVPCAAYFGDGGAGHYVKTVHNGIEYADMQMIAEIYGLMRDGQGRTAADISAVFDRWNGAALESYLVEIAAEVAAVIDPATGRPILDVIADRAGQKGTGRWTVMDAQRRAAPLPAVEAAVTARVLSGEAALRAEGERLFPESDALPPLTDAELEGALIAGKILAYSQGFTLLSVARGEEGWTMPLDTVARTWRAGCIIRSAMLDDMATALEEGTCARPLAFAPAFAERLRANMCRLASCRGGCGRGGFAGARAIGRTSAFRPAAPVAGHGEHDPGVARPVRCARIRADGPPGRRWSTRALGIGGRVGLVDQAVPPKHRLDPLVQEKGRSIEPHQQQVQLADPGTVEGGVGQIAGHRWHPTFDGQA